uniref:Uncharacterized protein n=1 Tax=Aegilops tauschii subsp. strangulata TaxID=200361 RepID=A0A453I772_AEGTS
MWPAGCPILCCLGRLNVWVSFYQDLWSSMSPIRIIPVSPFLACTCPIWNKCTSGSVSFIT